jgi:hypothetical protein
MRYGSSGKVPALQVQSPKFKAQSHPPKKKKKKPELKPEKLIKGIW